MVAQFYMLNGYKIYKYYNMHFTLRETWTLLVDL